MSGTDFSASTDRHYESHDNRTVPLVNSLVLRTGGFKARQSYSSRATREPMGAARAPSGLVHLHGVREFGGVTKVF
jgi:hypothetical protein